VQVRRVFGVQQSGGTLTSPPAALHLLLSQYDVFAPSFLIALVTLVLALRRLWRCYQDRDWRPVTGNALLWSWMASAIVIFGSIPLPMISTRIGALATIGIALNIRTTGKKMSCSVLLWTKTVATRIAARLPPTKPPAASSAVGHRLESRTARFA